MKNKMIVLLIVMSLLIGTLAACTKEDEENSLTKTEQTKQSTEVPYTDPDTDNANEKIVRKIEGRRREFLERLDNIQKELDLLPEKKDSDAGVTNAMRSYYGKSYEMYDKALNEIYTLLKKELSPEVVEDLKNKQVQWIEQKEAEATKEESKFEGGTFQFVARYISLYKTTKDRCYKLVNEYMTD